MGASGHVQPASKQSWRSCIRISCLYSSGGSLTVLPGLSHAFTLLVFALLQKALAEKFRAEYNMHNEDGSSTQHTVADGPVDATAAISQAPPKSARARQVTIQIACISRAGREPGYKKTNQDNCFAFEKYISEDQSMFGAMDGHGPHGKQCYT